MKKLYLFFAVLCAVLGTQVANAAFTGGNTYYLKVNNDDWKVSGGRYAAYFYNGDNDNRWYPMSAVSGESDMYQLTLDAGKDWNGVIFCRMNGGTDDNNWTNCWNQTIDLNGNHYQNMYTVIYKGSYDGKEKYSGDWSTYNNGGGTGGDDTGTDIPDVDLSKVNMPLKKADFANGKKHYFVVGTRMSEWRLQPEWELQPQADGTYVLENRLVYTGKMGIAVVDTYEDYIYQRYRFYSDNTWQKEGETYTVNLSQQTNYKTINGSNSKFTAIRYNDGNTHGQFETEKTFRFEYNGNNLDEEGIRCSTPTLVGKMTLTLDSSSKNPTTFVMSSITTKSGDIAQYRTFSLVGSDIAYVGADWAKATPLYLQSGFADIMKNESWQEGWIQYDKEGMPYVDAYGNTIYQTVFQKKWLEEHPTFFRTADGFEYNSINMVLNYDSTQKHENTIKTTDTETVWYCNDNGEKGTGGSYTAASGWQCFVLENMWLAGEFKVWTGWGGANKKHDGSDHKFIDARWNYDNGGHEWDNNDWLISAAKNTYYMTKRDNPGADYSLGNDRVFARYVKLWWNPDQGFDGSLIQIITEFGGPQIQCKRTGKKNLSYTYEVPLPTGYEKEEDAKRVLEQYNVKSYTINRWYVGKDGQEVLDVANVEHQEYAYSENKKATAINSNGKYKADPNEAENGGTYFYKIIVEYYANAAAGEPVDFSRDAESNRVFIFYKTQPVEPKVVQLAYKEATAETEVTDDGKKYWSFDLRFTAGLPEGLKGIEVNGNPIETLINYYVVGIPKHGTESLYTDIEVIYANGTIKKASELKFFNTKEDLAPYLWVEDLGQYQFGINTYFGVEPDAGNGYAMPKIIFKNVIPGNYTLYVSMGALDTDVPDWAQYNVESASASVEMYVPSTYYMASEFMISPVDETSSAIDESLLPMGVTETQPMAYTKANKISTTNGRFEPLMVTNGVLADWSMDYIVKLTDVRDINGNTKYTYTLEGITGKALNEEVPANFDYLPIGYTEAGAGFNTCPIEKIAGIKSRTPNGGQFGTTTTVGYRRNVPSYTTGVVATTEEYPAGGTFDPEKMINGEYLVEYTKTDAKTEYQIEKSYNWIDETIDCFANYFVCLSFTPNKGLNNAAGYYAASDFSGGKLSGYTVVKEGGIGYETKAFPAEGGEVTYGSGYDKNPEYQLDGFVPGDATKNFAEAIAAEGRFPVKVWYVGDGDKEPASKLYFAYSADYPVIIKPTLKADFKSKSVADGVFAAEGVTEKMITLSYPSIYESTGGTTDITDIVVDGASDFRIYPNPAVDVVNVAASAALGTIEIYSVDGRLVKTVEVDDTRAAIEVGDLAKGNYIVRAAGAVQQMIKK